MKKIKENLEEVQKVPTTANVWMTCHRSCLGMTVHWIDEKCLKRQKAAIACFRIVWCHSYNILAEKIEEVHKSFGLHGKISATVTDNGSNFVKLYHNYRARHHT